MVGACRSQHGTPARSRVVCARTRLPGNICFRSVVSQAARTLHTGMLGAAAVHKAEERTSWKAPPRSRKSRHSPNSKKGPPSRLPFAKKKVARSKRDGAVCRHRSRRYSLRPAVASALPAAAAMATPSERLVQTLMARSTVIISAPVKSKWPRFHVSPLIAQLQQHSAALSFVSDTPAQRAALRISEWAALLGLLRGPDSQRAPAAALPPQRATWTRTRRLDVES